jgi:hypothetical protein
MAYMLRSLMIGLIDRKILDMLPGRPPQVTFSCENPTLAAHSSSGLIKSNPSTAVLIIALQLLLLDIISIRPSTIARKSSANVFQDVLFAVKTAALVRCPRPNLPR